MALPLYLIDGAPSPSVYSEHPERRSRRYHPPPSTLYGATPVIYGGPDGLMMPLSPHFKASQFAHDDEAIPPVPPIAVHLANAGAAAGVGSARPPMRSPSSTRSIIEMGEH